MNDQKLDSISKTAIVAQRQDKDSSSGIDYRTLPASLREICSKTSLSAKKKYPKFRLEKVEEFCIVTAIDCLGLAEKNKDMRDEMAALFNGRTIELNGVEHLVSAKESIYISCAFMGSQRLADLVSKGETELLKLLE